jgi:hypothetical protein
VIVFGAGRPQNGLLISPARPIIGNRDFLNEIWPTVEQMNRVVPAHSRVVKELVLVEDPELPFAATDKGTVREKLTLSMYAEQIDKAYEELEMNQRDELVFPKSFEEMDISAFLQDALHTLLPDRDLTSEVDLFEQGKLDCAFDTHANSYFLLGMDSLLAVRLQRFVVQLLQKAQPSSSPIVPKNVVYDHPSISALVKFILSKISGSSQPQAIPEDDVTTRVRRSVEKFTKGLAPRSVQVGGSKYEDDGEYVVVTGTTGSLGSFLVDQLLDRPGVKRIYCFNRKTDSDTTQRQLTGFKDRGLDPVKLEKALGDRVTMHDVDLSQTRLGLSESDYEEVR